MSETPGTNPDNSETDSVAEEQEIQEPVNFHREKLAMLSRSYDGFEAGIQDFHNKRAPTELILAEIEDIPGHGLDPDVWENILLSLPNKAWINFEEFKQAVQETVDTLFQGKAKIHFPNEKYIDWAIECMKDDSFDGATAEGKDVLKGVAKLFGFDVFQMNALLKDSFKEKS